MEGEAAYTLLYYPLNIDKLLDLGSGTRAGAELGAHRSRDLGAGFDPVQYLIDMARGST